MIGFIQAVFLSVVLPNIKKGNKTANNYLAILLIVIAVIIFHSLYLKTQFWIQFPYASLVSYQFWFFLSPAIYFYIRALISKPIKLNTYLIIHFSPFLISTLFFAEYYLMESESLLLIFGDADQMQKVGIIFTSIYTLQSVIYLYLIFKIISNYSKIYYQNSANTQIYFLDWIKWIFYGLVLFIVFDTASYYVLLFLEFNTVFTSKISLTGLTIFSFVVTYFIIVNPDIILPKMIEAKEKYKHSKLDEKKLDEYKTKIENYMKAEQPFLDNEFDLKALSKKIDISTHQLSQILNQEIGLSFYDFINKLRVEEVKKRLLTQEFENKTILAVALEVGFNSNASFYRIFKKHTGKTPSEFIKTNK